MQAAKPEEDRINKELKERVFGVATCLDFLPPQPCTAAALPFTANATFACLSDSRDVVESMGEENCEVTGLAS